MPTSGPWGTPCRALGALDIPAWASDHRRFLGEPHFPEGLDLVVSILLGDSPIAFRRLILAAPYLPMEFLQRKGLLTPHAVVEYRHRELLQFPGIKEGNEQRLSLCERVLKRLCAVRK